MGSSTVTETYTDRECKQYETTLKSEIHKHAYFQDTPPCYDDLLPQNEGPFLTQLRLWEKRVGFVTPLKWSSIFFIALYHVVAVVWFVYYTYCGYLPKWETVAFSYFMGNVAGFGVTGGVHRYWSHRSFKAKWPLQLLLVYCYSVAGQNTIYEWVRDHRVHHKFSETSADPHDARRGFFFSHVGWLMMKKHPEVLKQGSKIDMSDVTDDPLVQFHTKYFTLFKLAFCFVLPTFVPALLWGETWHYAVLSQPFLRYICSLNFTWSVNSFAHLSGNKPYNRFIMPSENWGVSFVAMGEGWHNFHHTFPWDYKASELAYTLNITTVLLDFFAKIGWAYDMKKASPCLVRAVAIRKGELKKNLK